MPIIVQKYGGSSVADIERLQKVAQKIVATHEAGHRVVVVVSAMGNATNELLERAHQISQAPNRRELDMLLSVGERTSMALLSMGIHALGHKAISFTGSQSGIVTNDAHSNAKIIDVRPYRVQDELERGHIVIVAGYQGTSYRREITTLGRGGSDMTAVALAAALGAERCEIYSDVDGVYSSDPRVVLDAQRLLEISADEMLELARHGAKVLHGEAVAYAKAHRIALYAKATHKADSQGTIVRPDGWPEEALERASIQPRGLASHPFVLELRSQQGLRGLCQMIEQCLPAARLLHLVSDGCSRVFLDPTNTGTAQQVRAKLDSSSSAAQVEVSDTHTNITLVGPEIGRSAHWIAALDEVLGRAGLAPREHYLRESSVSAILPRAQREEAMRVAHALVAKT